ncbi:hypothetical protein FD729_01050 [Pantoea sp. Nvir]|uniref:hypothetical protein n=2 Tax=Pantoea sp. Nvir TaxID=2576760 RepID=UPI00135B2B5A|nr:hypothetical protein [Pantoea sp. Nvir]MXP66366.1 hypothetical protein [Pantoea sp. Nvir]
MSRSFISSTAMSKTPAYLSALAHFNHCGFINVAVDRKVTVVQDKMRAISTLALATFKKSATSLS